MTRAEFIDEIKGKDKTEITIDDCINYYKYFHSIEPHLREKMLGRATLIDIGHAYRVYWESSIMQYAVMDRQKVQTPCGLYLVSNKDQAIRKKWFDKVPPGTSKKRCMEIMNEIQVVKDVKRSVRENLMKLKKWAENNEPERSEETLKVVENQKRILQEQAKTLKGKTPTPISEVVQGAIKTQ